MEKLFDCKCQRNWHALTAEELRTAFSHHVNVGGATPNEVTARLDERASAYCSTIWVRYEEPTIILESGEALTPEVVREHELFNGGYYCPQALSLICEPLQDALCLFGRYDKNEEDFVVGGTGLGDTARPEHVLICFPVEMMDDETEFVQNLQANSVVSGRYLDDQAAEYVAVVLRLMYPFSRNGKPRKERLRMELLEAALHDALVARSAYEFQARHLDDAVSFAQGWVINRIGRILRPNHITAIDELGKELSADTDQTQRRVTEGLAVLETWATVRDTDICLYAWVDEHGLLSLLLRRPPESNHTLTVLQLRRLEFLRREIITKVHSRNPAKILSDRGHYDLAELRWHDFDNGLPVNSTGMEKYDA